MRQAIVTQMFQKIETTTQRYLVLTYLINNCKEEFWLGYIPEYWNV